MEKPKERHWRFQRQSIVTQIDEDKTSGGGWRIGGVQSQGEEEELKITHAAFVSVMHFQTQCQLEANIFSRKKIEVCTSKLLNWQPAQIN